MKVKRGVGGCGEHEEAGRETSWRGTETSGEISEEGGLTFS